MKLPVYEPILNFARWARREYDLKDAWALVEAAHTPNLGYHNLLHIELVTGAAVLLALREDFDPRVAAISAIFHDCGHTGRQPDAQNIEQALTWFDVWYKRIHTLNLFGIAGAGILDEETANQIRQAIACTEYRDGAFPIEPKSTLDKILRDADVWSPHYEAMNCAYMVRGLARELKSTIAPEVFFTKQIMFFDSITWYTKLGQQLSSRVNENLNRALFPEIEYEALRPDRKDDEEPQ